MAYADDDTGMKAPREEEGGLLRRAYTMSTGFYGRGCLPSCFPHAFAGMKWTIDEIISGLYGGLVLTTNT